MKKVISNEELYEVMSKAINLLCDSASSTLGPSGNNVIINTDEVSPFITNDGVTIAKSIESDEKCINTILEIAKEAALKTNEEVGDGTTTTLVLLQAIFLNGLEEIKSGKDPIILKKELDTSCSEIIKKLDSLKKIPTKDELVSIATTSCGDYNLSLLINEVYNKMKSKYSIRIEENKSDDTYYEIKKGYSLNTDISNLYFKDKKYISINNIYTLLIRGYLENLEQISDIINEGLINNKNILILAEDYDENIANEIILYYLKHNKNIFLFKVPDFASRKNSIYEDIKTISNSTIKNIDYEDISFNDLGNIKNLTIKKDEIILFNDNKNISKYIKKLKEELETIDNDYDKEFIETRLSKLENGVAIIYVGAPTKTEIKEKMLRLEDALYSIFTASYGITLGEGIPFLKISEEIDNLIFKKTLQEPFIRIMKNSGVDYKSIQKEIKKYNYQRIYNIEKNIYEEKTNILDPVEIVKISLKNATSIATMLLTTRYLVVNEIFKNSTNEEYKI